VRITTRKKGQKKEKRCRRHERGFERDLFHTSGGEGSFADPSLGKKKKKKKEEKGKVRDPGDGHQRA